MSEMTDPATQVLTFKYRLNPTRQQHRALERILEQQRQLYNAALEERISAFSKGISITYNHQSKSLTAIRRDDPSFAGEIRRIQCETLSRLDLAYKAFFRRAKAGDGASSGFPKFKGRERFNGFGFDAFQQIKFDGKRLRFSGMPGGLRVCMDRQLLGAIKGVWFNREGKRWSVGFQAEAPLRSSREGLGRSNVGVDWGTSVLAALSTGEAIENPRPGEKLQKDLARAQRAVARKKKGSRSRRKARAKLQSVQRRIANKRKNHLNKVASRLVQHWKCVAVEKIEVKRMMNAERPGEKLPEFVKRRRNREALEAAPYMLRQMLTYKAVRDGAELIVVDPKNTTQECFSCGRLKFKQLSEMEHKCDCGIRIPRKVNAARVIMKRAGLGPWGAPQGANGSNSSRRPGNTDAPHGASGQRPTLGLPSASNRQPHVRMAQPPNRVGDR